MTFIKKRKERTTGLKDANVMFEQQDEYVTN